MEGKMAQKNPPNQWVLYTEPVITWQALMKLLRKQKKKKSFPPQAALSGRERTRGKVKEIEFVVYGDVISVPLPLFHCVLVAFPITDHFSRHQRATWDLLMILWESPDLRCEQEPQRGMRERKNEKMHETDRKWSRESVSEKKRGKRR